MKIARLNGPHDFELIEAPVPQVKPDEVLVRVVSCGVCTGELDMWLGNASKDVYPRFPGHEISGYIEAVGAAVTSLKMGEPVGVWTDANGYAEYTAVKAAYCASAGSIPLDVVLAEPLACAVNAVEMTGIAAGDDVVIIGAGFMGNLIQKLVALKSPRTVIVADTRADALERAKRLGASRTVNVLLESLPAAVKEATGGKGADVSFEVTGTEPALQALGDVTRMSGKVVIVGFHQGGMRAVNLAYWNWMAFQIINAHIRDVNVILKGMRTGMELLTAGRIDLSDLVTHRYPLKDINKAFETACEKPQGFTKATIII